MARAAKLKVYRTPIGFHDAYVAASSQKAALRAWGADADLFARGVAEIVTDAALTKAPLEAPGEIVRRPRGTAAEHLAALPPDTPKPARKRAADPPAGKRSPPPKPRPDRSVLEAAEQALDEARRRFGDELDRLRAEEAALQRNRRELERERDAETGRLSDAAGQARAAYDAAMRRWRA